MPARAITASAPPTAAPVSAALDVLSDAFEDAAAAAEVLFASALDEETSFFDVSAFELEASDFESAFEASVFDSPPSADATPKSSVIESVPPLKAPSFSQPATSGQAFFVTSPVSSGLINTALMKLHIISSPLQILYTNGSITIGLVQYLLPFAVMPLYSSIEKLDEATIEASYDLGAGKIKTFIKVILPMTFPGIIAAFIILFVSAIGTYFITDVIGGGTVYMIGNIICNQFLSARNWPLGAALSVCVVIFILLMLYLYSRIGNLDDLGAM